MRVITDEVYAGLVKVLAQDEKVALFQQLLLSKKIEPQPQQPAQQPDQEEKKGE